MHRTQKRKKKKKKSTKNLPFWTLVTAFLKIPKTDPLSAEGVIDLSNCWGGGWTGGGTTTFLGDSKTGCGDGGGLGVDGGVMKTV